MASLTVGLGPYLGPTARAAIRARAGVDVAVEPVVEPLDPASAHLIVDGRTSDAVDVALPDDADAAEDLWNRRLLPFAHNLAAGRRAPRVQVVALTENPTWAAAARRLGVRLHRALGDVALRVEHVGSTSVPGMSGKDLVDLLVVVPSLAVVDALDLAVWRRAGVVLVRGNLYGIDRHDRQHDQRVAVDADPGRPVNVHLHPVSSPVWREQLAFRDWLRADTAHRAEYLDLKERLAADAGGDVNAYSRAKRQWINDAVRRAMG